MVDRIMQIEDKICRSIHDHKLLKITYKEDPERIIEPYAYGLNRHGRKLSAYQISGFSTSGNVPHWKLFKVELINRIEELDQQFKVRSNYNPDYKIIPGVICKI